MPINVNKYGESYRFQSYRFLLNTMQLIFIERVGNIVTFRIKVLISMMHDFFLGTNTDFCKVKYSSKNKYAKSPFAFWTFIFSPKNDDICHTFNKNWLHHHVQQIKIRFTVFPLIRKKQSFFNIAPYIQRLQD